MSDDVSPARIDTFPAVPQTLSETMPLLLLSLL